MARLWSESTARQYHVAEIVPPLAQDKWVSLSLVQPEDTASMDNCIVAVKSFSVNTSSPTIWCPFFLTWNGRDLVRRRYDLGSPLRPPLGGHGDAITRVHGFSSPQVSMWSQWERWRDASQSLVQNVQGYFLSNVRMSYLRLTNRLKSDDKTLLDLCPGVNLKTFFPNKHMAVVCLYGPRGEVCSTVDNELKDFVSDIIDNPMLYEIFFECQRDFMNLLSECGLSVAVDQDDNAYIHNETHYLLPLGAIRSMMCLFHELELNNFIHYNSGGTAKPIVCHVLVPKSNESVTLTVSVEVCLGTRETFSEGHSDTLTSSYDQSQFPLSMVNSRNSAIIPHCHTLYFSSDPETIVRNLDTL